MEKQLYEIQFRPLANNKMFYDEYYLSDILQVHLWINSILGINPTVDLNEDSTQPIIEGSIQPEIKPLPRWGRTKEIMQHKNIKSRVTLAKRVKDGIIIRRLNCNFSPEYWLTND